MKRPAILPMLLCAWLAASAQEAYTYDSYYYRRASLFELLPTDTTDIVMLGNSLTDGCEWHELLQDVRVKNRGISADVVAGVQDRLLTVMEGRPAKVFLLIGINDVSHNLGADSIAGQIARAVELMHASSPQTRIYVQSLLPVNAAMRYKRLAGKDSTIVEINHLLEARAEEQGYVYIDLYSHFTLPGTMLLDPQYTNDGLHLMGTGYVLWASLLKPYIDQ